MHLNSINEKTNEKYAEVSVCYHWNRLTRILRDDCFPLLPDTPAFYNTEDYNAYETYCGSVPPPVFIFNEVAVVHTQSFLFWLFILTQLCVRSEKTLPHMCDIDNRRGGYYKFSKKLKL